GCGSVERFHSCREVVRLSLEGNHRIDFTCLEKVGLMSGFRSKLLGFWATGKCYVVFVCGSDPVGMLLGSFFDQLEKRLRLFLPVDDKSAIEDLVAAVFGVHLRESKNL